MISAIECITRRPISQRALLIVHRVGAYFLLTIMVGLTANDILGLLTRTNIF